MYVARLKFPCYLKKLINDLRNLKILLLGYWRTEKCKYFEDQTFNFH